MIHHVFANRSNIGDWLSALAIRSLINQPTKEHLCDGSYIEETLQELAMLSPSDFVIIGGGGLWMDYFTPFWTGFRALRGKVRYALWGVGVCSHKDRLTSSCANPDLLRDLVEHSEACSVRDVLSSRHVAPSKAQVIPCPAINWIRRNASKWNGNVLCVEHPDLLSEQDIRRVRTVARSYAEATGRKFEVTRNIIPAGHYGELHDILLAYDAADVVVTSRLHGCIIGLACGKKVVAVSNDKKIESFMYAAGLSDWVCNPKGVSDKLLNIGDQPDVSGFIEECKQQNIAFAEEVHGAILKGQ